MRIFSFRSKRLLRRVLLTVLAVLLAAALLLLCRFLYLSRYVVYSGNEAYLDFDRTLSATRDPQQTQNPDDFPFTTLIASQSPDEPQTQQRSKIQGYYITTNMLSDGVDAVRAALDAANDYDAVMIDVKSVFGNYYYRSKLSGAQIATSADIDAVEALIRELTARTDLTVIARVPAFSEPNYAFAHQNQALALYSGALWMDEKRCYWLDPSDASVQSFLASIALELQDLGFDEVLFDQFYFPSSDAINWSSDLGLTRRPPCRTPPRASAPRWKAAASAWTSSPTILLSPRRPTALPLRTRMPPQSNPQPPPLPTCWPIRPRSCSSSPAPAIPAMRITASCARSLTSNKKPQCLHLQQKRRFRMESALFE